MVTKPKLNNQNFCIHRGEKKLQFENFVLSSRTFVSKVIKKNTCTAYMTIYTLNFQNSACQGNNQLGKIYLKMIKNLNQIIVWYDYNWHEAKLNMARIRGVAVIVNGMKID
jgi:hypothetical protein